MTETPLLPPAGDNTSPAGGSPPTADELLQEDAAVLSATSSLEHLSAAVDLLSKVEGEAAPIAKAALHAALGAAVTAYGGPIAAAVVAEAEPVVEEAIANGATSLGQTLIPRIRSALAKVASAL